MRLLVIADPCHRVVFFSFFAPGRQQVKLQVPAASLATHHDAYLLVVVIVMIVETIIVIIVVRFLLPELAPRLD